MSKLLFSLLAIGATIAVVSLTKTDKKAYLVSIGAKQSIVDQMSSQELDDAYNYLVNYAQKNIKLTPGSYLYNSISTISQKYNIFT